MDGNQGRGPRETESCCSTTFRPIPIPVILNVFPRTSFCESRQRKPTLTTAHCQSKYTLKQCLNFTLWNARSVTDKVASLSDSIMLNKTDIFIVTESWVNAKNGALVDADLTSSLSGFTSHHVPRIRRRGGGIAILTRSNLKVAKNKCSVYQSFELMDVNIKTSSVLIHLLVIYRPPYSSKHKLTIAQFLTEFGRLLESVILSPGHLVIAGDINIHIDDPKCKDAANFLDLVTSLGLVQHVDGPTHVGGHTLDLVLTRASDSCLANFVVDNTMPSDHAAVHFCSTIYRPPPTKSTKQQRVLKNIDITILKDSIASTLNQSQPDDDVDALAVCYDQALTQAIDQQAPIRMKVMHDKPRVQ